jgi:hypothetical protein
MISILAVTAVGTLILQGREVTAVSNSLLENE